MSNITDEDFIKATKTFFQYLTENRPSWDDYSLLLAKLASCRSPDPSTKHGCVLCSQDHRIISTGYNGPPQNIPNNKVPLTRPEKYDWFLHAEENALIFSGKQAQNAIAYVTGMPCPPCMRKLVQQRISKICIGPQKSKCVDNEKKKVSLQMAKEAGIEVIELQSLIARAIDKNS